jgi:hypothetical protein
VTPREAGAASAAGAPRRIQVRTTPGWKLPDGAVYVGPRTAWANPFPVDHEGTAMHCLSIGLDGEDRRDRERSAVDLYKRWLLGGKVNEAVAAFLPAGVPRAPDLRTVRRDLRGRDLACRCPPGRPCHVDVLLEAANADAEPIPGKTGVTPWERLVLGQLEEDCGYASRDLVPRLGMAQERGAAAARMVSGTLRGLERRELVRSFGEAPIAWWRTAAGTEALQGAG